ncbi:helix-turn-helix domain-containing protein [Aquimarina algiphila]|uniref:helix-turn-helix domain-containing protein n=1 Tax=Aquimarina algiphila TaxID=2047982 RepID=UPI00232EF15E|nr:AraC family transcriptional regulator [Aquimarina algiphila]
MPTFEFIDLILFFGISQGVFLAATIQIIKNKNKAANRILSIMLMLAVFMLLGRMIFFKFLTARLFQWAILIDSVIFIFGPLCYMYFRRLIFSKNDTFKLSWLHYVPLTLHFSFSLYIFSFQVDDFSDKLLSGYFNVPFLCIEGAGIVSNIYYWILNMKILKSYIHKEKNHVSYTQSLVSFLKFFQIIIFIVITVWMISFTSMQFFSYSIKFINYNSVWGTISVFIFVIGYYSLKEPELFRIPFQKEKTKSQQRLPQDQIISIGKELNYLIQKEKIFLKPNLTLRDLSIQLNTSTHNISWYLNHVSKSNFYDYINHFRIKEFLSKIDNDEHLHHTILAIAMEVGFNSKSTFNKAFKFEVNDTPRNYIKGLKVA